MFVALYTSRLVLQVLGVIDMGIYNLVGGVVTLMSFLQTAQTKATSRYITYGLGLQNTDEQQKRIFSMCMTIHILIAIIVVFLAETIGLYIINNWTSIPPERVIAANVVYQISIFTFIVHIVRCPYDSVIIAHENMSIYAYMSVLEVFFQLGVVVGMLKYQGDSLVIYSFLIFVVAFFLYLLYYGYVKYKHPWYRFSWVWDKIESIRILSFSGWTLLGSTSNTLTQQGVGLLMNNLVGLIANTALGFANQVNMAVGRFISSFTTAFNPQIIKLYSNGDLNAMTILMNRASKFSFSLCYIIVLPLVYNMPFILHLWLGNVPQYTTEFCQLILICSTIDATTGVFNTAITATGSIRNYQIGISISFCVDFLCSFLLLSIGIHPAIVFGSRIITRGIFNMFVGFHYSIRLFDFPILQYIKTVLLPIFITLVFTIPSTIYIGCLMTGWLRLLVSSCISVLITTICVFVIIIDDLERKKIIKFVKNRL